MKTGTLTRVVLILAVIMALTAWGADKTQAASLTKITVAVPHPSAIIWIPLHVAIGEGYFKDEGLEVNVEAVDGSSQVLQVMSAGKAQIGIPGPGPVLAARARCGCRFYLQSVSESLVRSRGQKRVILHPGQSA